jgi:hypothetical protein
MNHICQVGTTLPYFGIKTGMSLSKRITKGISVNQKTSRWLKTIGIVLVAGSLSPRFVLPSFAVTVDGATWAASCSIVVPPGNSQNICV